LHKKEKEKEKKKKTKPPHTETHMEKRGVSFYIAIQNQHHKKISK
jgi:hypothetical protein